MTEKLVRGLGRWDLTAIAVNSIIGAGIFGLPSKVAALIGSYSIFAFLLCAVIIGVIVLCFAEVSSRFQTTGGMYLYTREAFGPAVGFEVGWLFWIARAATHAANSNLMLAYLSLFVPGSNEGWPRALLIIAVVGVLTAINILGIRESAVFTNVITVGKLLPLVIFAFMGLLFIEPSNFHFDAAPGYGQFSTAVLLTVYAFAGFENTVVPAGEAKNAQSSVPFAIVVAVAAVAVLYILVQTVSIGTLPGLASSERPLADASTVFLGGFGAAFISVGAIISIMGNLNTGLLTGSRIPFAMAEQRDIPAVFAKLHERFRTPVISILFTSAVILLLTLQSSFVTALTISTLSRLIGYAGTCAALLVLRRRADVPKPEFKVPMAPVAVLFSLVCIVGLLSNADYSKEGLAVAICAAVGLVLFLVFRTFGRRAAP